MMKRPCLPLKTTLKTVLTALFILVVVAACGKPSPTATPAPTLPPKPTATATPKPTATFTPPPTATPTPEPTATATPDTSTPVPLDLCSLVTEAEAEAVLDEQLEAQPAGLGNCTYSTSSFPQKSLMVGAAQGEEAKAISLLSAELLLMFSQDENIRETYERVKENLADMTVGEVVAETVSLFEAIGLEVESLSEVGDRAFWVSQSELGMGQLLMVKDDVFVYLALIGLDENVAFETALAMVEQIFDRLPARFTIPTSGQFEYEVTLPTVEVEIVVPTLAPTDTPTVQPIEPPAPTPTATPRSEFVEQAPYTGDCTQRPEGSVCAAFEDGYIWLIYDSVMSWSEGEPWEGKRVSVIQGLKADYYHVLDTLLVKTIPK